MPVIYSYLKRRLKWLYQIVPVEGLCGIVGIYASVEDTGTMRANPQLQAIAPFRVP